MSYISDDLTNQENIQIRLSFSAWIAVTNLRFLVWLHNWTGNQIDKMTAGEELSEVDFLDLE